MANSRVDRLRTLILEQDLDALFVTNDVNRKYLTGFTGTSGYVVITNDQAYLFTDFRYMEQANKQAQGFTVIEHQADHTATILETLQSQHIAQVGFEQFDISYASYHLYKEKLTGIALVPAGQMVEQLRMIKDERELALMQEAADLADRTFEHLKGFIRPGFTERDVALEIEFYMRSHGAASSSFDTIVASGERSALPHGVASDRILQTDEFVKLDFGAYLNGYCSDITRTLMLGKPSARHREIYDIVLEAQMYALDHIQPGMTGKQADALARDVITKYGYGDQFGHSLGHGLGMEIHEEPRLSMRGDHVLLPGMTVTVEPGIYIPGFGGVRIEDDVVVTDTGVRRLTQSDKAFTVINA